MTFPAPTGTGHMGSPSLSQANRAQSQHGTSQPHAASMDPNSTPSSAPRPPLTFFQRHFTKPVDTSPLHPAKLRGASDRRFSFASRGVGVSAATLAMLLFGVMAAAVALTTGGRHHHHHVGAIRLAVDHNFPDPALLFVHGTWYAFATNNGAGVLPLPGANATKNTVAFGQANVQLATTTDFVHWKLADLAHEPLPQLGAWASRTHPHRADQPKPPSSTWAPAVIQRNDGRYVMYYSATWNGPYPYPKLHGKATHPQPHCVGAAVSRGRSPAGPYEPEPHALACPVERGGAIDPEATRDVDGALYLTYKIDGNNIGRGGSCGNEFAPQTPTPIMLQKMMADGLTPDGPATPILDRTAADGPLVEGPVLVRSPGGRYFLFFSSGCTRAPSYAVKYAVARRITGPYVRARDALLSTGVYGLEAPGSVGVSADGTGGFKIAFHARAPEHGVGRVRKMYTADLTLVGDTARLAFPEHHQHGADRV